MYKRNASYEYIHDIEYFEHGVVHQLDPEKDPELFQIYSKVSKFSFDEFHKLNMQYVINFLFAFLVMSLSIVQVIRLMNRTDSINS